MTDLLFSINQKELIFNYGYKFEIKSVKKEFDNIIVTIDRKKNSPYKRQHYKMVLFYDDPGHVNFEAIKNYVKAQPEEVIWDAFLDSDYIQYTFIIHGPYEGWVN